MEVVMRIIAATIVAVAVAAAAGLLLTPCARPPVAAASAEARSRSATRLVIPASIEREHKELHARLAAATKAGGKTADAAKKLADLLHPHLAKEEQYALPPLGMLRAFADGEVPANAEEVLALTEKFRAEYPRMLEEHEAIVAALGELLVVARSEGHTETAEFAQELLRHAEHEEEILYPTTVLIGEDVKLMVAKDAPGAKRSLAPAQR
jgi:hypothetical protein